MNQRDLPNIFSAIHKFVSCYCSLQCKMMLYFSLLFIAILLSINTIRMHGIPFTSFIGEYKQRHEEVFEHLNVVADLRKQRLLDWFEERHNHIQILSNNPLLGEIPRAFLKNNTILNINDEKSEINSQPVISQDLSDYLQHIKDIYGVYDDIDVVETKTQKIIFSTCASNVGKLFHTPITTLQQEIINISIDEKSLFIAHALPAYQNFYLVFNIKKQALETILQTHYALGKTGETALVTENLQLLTNVKYRNTDDKPLQSMFCKIDGGLKTLKHLVKNRETGLFNCLDYRQEEVLAVYSPVTLNKATHWGIIVKTDKAEMFATLHQNMRFSNFIAAFISMVTGLGFTYLLAHLLARPLKRLYRTAQIIKAGNLDARASVNSQDEVGMLARIFNQVLDQMQQSKNELETLVEARTAELYKTNVSLAIKMDEMNELNTQMTREIALRKRVESEVKVKQMEQQIIFDSMPIFLWRKDLKNRIIWMNKVAAEFSGIPPETPNGYLIKDLFPEQAKEFYEVDLEIINTGQPKFHIITKIKNKFGEEIWIQIDKIPYINENGELMGIIVLAIDITARLQAEKARKESEKRFRTIVNTAVDGIVMIDESGVIQLLNPALANMFGYTIEELIHKKINALMPDPHCHQHDTYLENYKQSGQKNIIGVGREVLGKRKDGSTFPIFLAISELRLDNQLMFTGIITDITRLKQTQAELENSKKELEIQNKAYSRFVPREFLGFLGKDSIVDVQLGDQVQREMTVMFSDIRAFTELSEKLTPEKNFQFINEYLSKMEPVVKMYNGFIDKYIGDSVMALFPNSPDDAVCGSIAMLLTLEEYNKEREARGEKNIQIGIGLHTGSLMLGTIGGPNRMDGTVISDAVNLASRVEGLTKVYGTPLLITESTYNSLVDVNEYAIRIIDKVKVKGKSQPVIIFEVLDGEIFKIRDAKLATLKIFTDAFVAYQRRNFDIAEKLFEVCLERNPDDKAAKIYLKRARYWKNMGESIAWDGIAHVELETNDKLL